MRDDGVVPWASAAGANSATFRDLRNDVRERLPAFLPRGRHILGGPGAGRERINPVQAGNGADEADRRPAD